MTAICARFVGMALLGGVLAACGGSATRSSGEAAEPESGGTGAGTVGAAGAAGVAAGYGSAPQWLSDTKLDEAFPWFVQAPGGQYEMAPEDGDASMVHVSLEGMPVEATVSTHNHFAVVGLATAIEFSAWASEPLTMLVSVRDRLDDADYFVARAAGHDWPVAPVELSTQRQQFTIPFADMVPKEEPAEGTPSFMIGFIVEKPVGPLELWLDDVHFE